MKGDFSRIRFTPEKNYTAVLQQQGRVALDADANEQTAIDAYLRDTTNVDIIGEYGAPANDAGFAIRIENGKILIGAGRYYVSGILVENDREQDYADQRFLIPSGASDPSSASSLMAALESGTQSAQFILQVWRRFVTELDDPCLVEPAIGQADTTARLQTIWRVVGTATGAATAKPAAPPAQAAGSATAQAAAPKSVMAPAPAPASASAPQSASASASDVLLTVESSAGAGGCHQNPIELLSNCCQGLYRLVMPEHSGRMAAKTNPGGNDCGCQPIPAAGYQGLENQLYRVEIHTGGDHSTATFKWSRENGSVVAQITSVNGAIVTANSLGPDANLGFHVNDWVELIDDTSLYGDSPNQPGVLYQISALGPGPLQVTLSGAPNVNPAMNARMRRWDQSGASAAQGGIPLTAAPMTLEYGIEIDFTAGGNYVSGDYWTIPARTANGQIDWACGVHGDPFLPPGYFKIYQAPLACVQQPPNTNPPPPGTAPKEFREPDYVIQDCRIKFPPLTAITCGEDGPCTIVPRPGAGWEAPLLALKAGANADICFPVGKFPLTQPLVLSGLGHLRLTGGGLGTEIVATGVSAALVFTNCSSVEISSLYASTDTVIIRNKRGRPGLGGTLSFADCGVVSIDSVGLKCGAGWPRTAACIMVENSYVAQTKVQMREGDPVTGSGEVKIRHSDFLVGGGQEGILLVRVQRAQVEDNALVAYLPRQTTFYTRMQNRTLRASAMRVFISGAQYLSADTEARSAREKAPATPPSASAEPGATPATPPASGQQGNVQASDQRGDAQQGSGAAQPAKTASPARPEEVAEPVAQRKVFTTVRAGGQTIQFLTHPLLREFWQQYLDQYAPKIFSTNRDLLLFIKKTVRNFLLQPRLTRGYTAIVNVIAGLDKADLQGMARAISVAGEGIQECRILNNSIHDAVQGITVGMSNHKQNPNTREFSTVVTIAGNQIYVGLPPGAQFHNAQAIFVGNVESLLIENNCADVLTNVDEISREGIRVWGQFGRRIIVRHSHLAGFRPGIWFVPVTPPPNLKRPPLWLMADNMAENAFPVVVPASSPNLPNTVTSMWINNLP